ncbi:MAG: hypothetical protein ACKPKK_15155 [Dolichospermum sp.]
MNTYTIIKTTTKSVTVVFTLMNRKTGATSELKKIMRRYGDITNGLGWLEKSDFSSFIEATEYLLTAEEVAKIKRVYTPNALQKQEIARRVQARKDWYNNPANIEEMNREIKKMQNHKGFMTGNDITRELINETINKDVQKVYGLA